MVPGISFSGAIRDGRNKQRGWAGEKEPWVEQKRERLNGRKAR